MGFAFLFAVSGLFFSTALSAHPLHISLCEADYRAETGKLEIALRLFTDDAEVVLTRLAGKKVVVEKTAPTELDRLLLVYMQSAFAIKNRDGSPTPFTWIGHELKDASQHLWLYFECRLSDGVAGLRVEDRMMRDSFSDQLNSVLIREHPARNDANSPTRQVTLLFPDDAERAVVFPREK